MRVLVVGGAGYIGSHQVEMLSNFEHEVIVLDNLSTGFIQAIDKRAKFIQGDIRNFEQVRDILIYEKIEVVMHFAAFSIVSESITKPDEYYDNNVNGMKSLLNAMIEARVKKIIFSSSAAVYGIYEKMPIDETFPTNPINPYGKTKLLMEEMIRDMEKEYDIQYVALRYFNAAGASKNQTIGESHRCETHLIPLILNVATGHKNEIKIYGNQYKTKDGTCVRDYVHVEDICLGHMRAMEYLIAGGKSDVFNLGYGYGYSVKEIIETVKKVTNKSIEVSISSAREGDPAKLIANSEKAKKILNWKPINNDIFVIVKSAYIFHKRYPYGFEK